MIDAVRREDLRELLISVGLDLLIDEGLALGTERLTFKRVFDRAAAERGVRVTNASVIGRIWTDMADYQADVLAAALQNDDVDGMAETILAAARVADDADLTTEDGRSMALVEMIRVGCEAHVAAVTGARKADVLMGLRGLSVSRLSTEEGSPTAARVRRAYEEFASRWDFVFTNTFAVLGIRLRPGCTVRQLSMLAISLLEGFTIWDRLDPSRTRHLQRGNGADPTEQEWSLFALGVEALVRQFTELDEWPGPDASEGPAPAPDASERHGVAPAGNPE